jgi:signal transduction histidine kinase
MQRLPRQILASAALSVVASVALVFALVLAALPIFYDSVTRGMIESLDPSGCDAAPESWGTSLGAFSLYAYDTSGRSSHPAAPPVEPELLARALGTGEIARNPLHEPLSVAVLQRAESGPCAVLRSVSKRPPGHALRALFGVLALAGALGTGLASLGSYRVVVRPLRRRIEALAQAAGRVGKDDFAPAPGQDDHLGHIAAVLETSHGRIVRGRAELEARNAALEHHLASVAHDLRTPLASMQLALEALASETPDALQPEARRALADAVYLAELVDNLHQGARLRHELDVAGGAVELGALVLRLEARFQALAHHAGVELAVSVPDAPVWAGCTPVLAERALANLVQNAVQHNDHAGREHGPGHVAVLLQTRADGFTLTVLDDGPGLPAELAATLAEESFLLDPARPRGPGLGMLITAEIARRAGWSLDFSSVEPRGLRACLAGARRAPPA